MTDNVNDYNNHSGGAVGADHEWEKQGGRYSVVTRHYWYGKRTPYGNVEITEAELEEGKQHVWKANKVLHRKPEKYMNLLARNYCQVKKSEAIYAIGHLRNGIVPGGTGWAVQMAIDDGKPVFVFDQTTEKWFKYESKTWRECEVPTLSKNFAGIGSRKIMACGIQAIAEVYRKTFGEQ